MMKPNEYIRILKNAFPQAKCELNYNKDYELLIATMLSAQTTDKKVNDVTSILFTYSLNELANMNIERLEKIIKPIGTYKKKAVYVQNIAKRLLSDYNGKVPNNREYIEGLSGCGHKTCNVVLSNLYDEDCIAVDTHVSRVAKRLGLASFNDDVLTIESKLNSFFANNNKKDLHHRMVLFGRYICTAKNPACLKCEFNSICKYKK